MLRAHVIRLYPDDVQDNYLARCCGVSRFAYNWALSRWNEIRESGGNPSCNDLRKELNAIKRDQFPWMMDVTKCAPMTAIEDLQQAFRNFFEKRSGYPKMKSKNGSKESFRIGMESGNFRFDSFKIRIPRIGWIKTAEMPRWPSAKMISVTIKRTSDRWYASVKFELPDENHPAIEGDAIGIDLGLTTFAVLSTNERIHMPPKGSGSAIRMRRLSKSLSRKVQGSNNWRKSRAANRRFFGKMTSLRHHFMHRETSRIARKHSHIAIEDLNASGLGRNQNLSARIYDSGFRIFRDMLQYKAQKLTICDRWFPSSKTCSNCSTVNNELPLSARSWTCPKCGMVHDRDHNAAKNLAQIATRPAAISVVAACGDLGKGQSVNQEILQKID